MKLFIISGITILLSLVLFLIPARQFTPSIVIYTVYTNYNPMTKPITDTSLIFPDKLKNFLERKYGKVQQQLIIKTLIEEYNKLKSDFEKFDVSLMDILQLILTESDFINVTILDTNKQYSVGVFQLQYSQYKFTVKKYQLNLPLDYSYFLNKFSSNIPQQIMVGIRFYHYHLLNTKNKFYALNRYNGRVKWRDLDSKYIKRFKRKFLELYNDIKNS